MSQNIPQEATKLKKLTKISARYIELEQFKDSDHHTGYFCKYSSNDNKNRSLVHLGKVNDNINPTLLIDMKYNRMSENLINKQKNCFPGFALG